MTGRAEDELPGAARRDGRWADRQMLSRVKQDRQKVGERGKEREHEGEQERA